MLKREQVITIATIAVVFFLIGTTFITLTMAKAGGNPFDRIWAVISELQSNVGRVEDDVSELRSKVESLNTSYLDLLDRVEILESQMLPPEFITAPAYDSGWVVIEGSHKFYHYLNTTDIFIYLMGRQETWTPGVYVPHQRGIGGAGQQVDGFYEYGLWIDSMWNDYVEVERGVGDHSWQQARVMIWLIQEPPTD